MPCPHFEVSIVKRSDDKSAVASAAYQSGMNLFSEYQQKWKRYADKLGVLHAEIMLPENAPDAYQDRSTLWNGVEKAETQWNAQLARRVIMALPIEVPREQYPEMVREYCQKYFVDEGMCCDFAIHDEDKEPRNPHAHILLTLRSMDEHGKWLPKCRKVYDLDGSGSRIPLPNGGWKSHRENVNDWNNPQNCETWRHGWEEIQNQYLEQNQRSERVDLRSYQRQNKQQIPTVHLGRAVSAMEARGEKTFLGDLNRDIRETNKLLAYLRKGFKTLRTWAADKIKAAKERHEQKQIEKHPPINDYLYSWVLIQNDKRQHWKNHTVVLKRMAKDMMRVSKTTDFLKENNIFTIEDLKARLDDLEKETGDIHSELKQTDQRLKNITGILNAAQTLQQLQAIHDQYTHTFFKSKKESFYAEHEAELKQYGKAYHYLMKVNGGISVDPAALETESERLTAREARLHGKLEPMKPILDSLHFVKRCVDVVIKDQEPPSIIEQLEAVKQQNEAQRQARQEEEQRKQYEQNIKAQNKATTHEF